MKRPRDRFSHPCIDRRKVIGHDVPERYREEHTGVHVSPAIDCEMRESAHHATRLLRRLGESNVIDEGVLFERACRVSPEKKVHHYLPVLSRQKCVVRPGGKSSAWPWLEHFDHTGIEILNEIEISPEIPRSDKLAGYAHVGVGEDTGFKEISQCPDRLLMGAAESAERVVTLGIHVVETDRSSDQSCPAQLARPFRCHSLSGGVEVKIRKVLLSGIQKLEDPPFAFQRNHTHRVLVAW